jgi:hypothetical protein
MSLEDMNGAARDHVCYECKGKLIVTGGAPFGYDGYILRCINNPDHMGIKKAEQPHRIISQKAALAVFEASCLGVGRKVECPQNKQS